MPKVEEYSTHVKVDSRYTVLANSYPTMLGPNQTKESKKNKRLQVAFTHARVLMGSSVYRPGPEED